MSRIAAPKRNQNFPQKIEYDSQLYKDYREYLKTRMGSNGLSLCGTHRVAYNPYWREKHKLMFGSDKCALYLPKDWIPEEKFLDILIKHQMIEGENMIIRPIEYDEDENADNTNYEVNILRGKH